MEWLDVILLVVANGIVDCIFVAWVAGIRSKQAMEDWLESEKADKVLDKIADHVESKMEPRLSAFEERLNAPVELDLKPIVAMVTEAVVPHVSEEINRVRAFIDGKIGFVRKVAKQTGEAVAEVAGEEVAIQAAGGDPVAAEMMGELDGLLSDAEWVKDHRLAAFGLRILKRQQTGGAGGLSTDGESGYSPGLRRKR